MTLDDFINAVAGGPGRKRLRMGPVALGMARRILCDGLTGEAAAREAGRTRSEATRAARRVRQAIPDTSCPTCGRPTQEPAP